MVTGAAWTMLTAVMLQFNRENPAALADHLTAIHRATGVGIVVPHYSVASGVSIDCRDLAEPVIAVPTLVAVKSECSPIRMAIAMLTKDTSGAVFGGLGGISLLDEFAAGEAGTMTGFSYPDALVATVRAWGEGGFEKAPGVFAPWLPLVNFEAQPGVGLAIHKKCLRSRKLIADLTVRVHSQPLQATMISLLQQQIAAADQRLRQQKNLSKNDVKTGVLRSETVLDYNYTS